MRYYREWGRKLTGLPVTVPRSFLGMCYSAYPVTGPNTVGVLPLGSLRLLQIREVNWLTIETSPGVYSAAALANLDAIISHARANNIDVHFGMYGTPTFYASTAARPTYGDNVTKGPWGYLGECAYPTSLAAVTNFTTMIINRYNKPGGAWYDANFTSKGKGIQYWETWNEPDHKTGNGNTTGVNGNGAGFFWGTSAQMVDLAYTQYAAVKAADPSVIVLSPGFYNSLTPIEQFISATGTITGKTGLQACDELAYHPYRLTPPGKKYGLYTDDIINGSYGIAAVKNLLELYGSSKPIHINEVGVDYTSSTPEIAAWNAGTPEFRYVWTMRLLMTAAAMGIKSWHPWHWQITSSPTLAGNFQNDFNGVIKAYQMFNTHLVGKTIVECSYKFGGAVTLRTSDGITLSV